MYVKRMAGTLAFATGVGIAAWTSGLVGPAPWDPPPSCPDCQPAPDQPGSAPQRHPFMPKPPVRRVGPGSPRGGGQPSYRGFALPPPSQPRPL